MSSWVIFKKYKIYQGLTGRICKTLRNMCDYGSSYALNILKKFQFSNFGGMGELFIFRIIFVQVD